MVQRSKGDHRENDGGNEAEMRARSRRSGFKVCNDSFLQGEFRYIRAAVRSHVTGRRAERARATESRRSLFFGLTPIGRTQTEKLQYVKEPYPLMRIMAEMRLPLCNVLYVALLPPYNDPVPGRHCTSRR